MTWVASIIRAAAFCVIPVIAIVPAQAYDPLVGIMGPLESVLFPASTEDCQRLAEAWREVIKDTNEAHEQCLEKHADAERGKKCSKEPCENLHNRLSEGLPKRSRDNVKLCFQNLKASLENKIRFTRAVAASRARSAKSILLGDASCIPCREFDPSTLPANEMSDMVLDALDEASTPEEVWRINNKWHKWYNQMYGAFLPQDLYENTDKEKIRNYVESFPYEALKGEISDGARNDAWKTFVETFRDTKVVQRLAAFVAKIPNPTPVSAFLDGFTPSYTASEKQVLMLTELQIQERVDSKLQNFGVCLTMERSVRCNPSVTITRPKPSIPFIINQP